MSFPLFPLNTVLFPGCRLDLQIFEARYLDMIGRCMKQNGGFGVVAIVEGEEVGDAPERYSLVGCEAHIKDWKQQSNGLLGIRVEGGRRFRVLSANVQTDQLTVAEVEWLDEQPNQPLTKEHDDLAALLEALSMHPMVSALEMGGEVNGQQELACQLAYLLPFERDQKQVLLEMSDPTVRLARIQVLLEQLQGDFVA
ncbi:MULTISPECIES: LON peptidase substrate-binding domain-containing protein [Pseudomonas]|uniref:LON peptidase substrate-binding domain-containing protein n=1 Tax=Pseudomonas nitroreducens TaxID=46680 RepID=A0ABS0KJ53_PSENT|nr:MULTISPECIES: LON peptidase substrate-binding domain-containing protein [Pseudomonas]MBG6287954.1 LON peptidase substrate-binding domain-containing protein [Pseudomonas nitroreducens]NMZ62034.1 ATP-dependent protease [Pseudomonas nitroreducens]NNN25979.1 ATP-dependent protease [Pseudomonas nitroreducens]UCL87949.1 LON peptidase substrate-binding domain-containing protein [Pseudomonas sp. HS-18]WEX00055.1 LON peptidase substrate-binding domain-containing protein [Pseudomonas nitroreducens]